jgi:hypothetical protein
MRLTEAKAEAIAKPAIREALQPLVRFPAWVNEQLVLGTYVDGDICTVELYVAGEMPIDAVVPVEATVNLLSGQVDVVTFPERWSGQTR